MEVVAVRRWSTAVAGDNVTVATVNAIRASWANFVNVQTTTRASCQVRGTCIMPGTSEVCSGQGTCTCGTCSCHSIDDVLYTGRYCEECPTCSSGKCREFRDCVLCRVFNSGRLAGQACSNCTLRPRVLPNLDALFTEVFTAQVEAGARLCTFVDDKTGCDFNFTYEYRASTQDYFLFAQEIQQCPEELDVLGVVLGVIGAVVAVGLLTLLLWKVLTTIHDRREFARFEAERSKAQWATVSVGPGGLVNWWDQGSGGLVNWWDQGSGPRWGHEGGQVDRWGSRETMGVVMPSTCSGGPMSLRREELERVQVSNRAFTAILSADRIAGLCFLCSAVGCVLSSGDESSCGDVDFGNAR
ncbi:Integrin beta subunit cytoplasmic domain [Trinorchestia longiramus]|nr:Integrin beta subunit cytoplasmic domain [Trinorchestia longiramus]